MTESRKALTKGQEARKKQVPTARQRVFGKAFEKGSVMASLSREEQTKCRAWLKQKEQDHHVFERQLDRPDPK